MQQWRWRKVEVFVLSWKQNKSTWWIECRGWVKLKNQWGLLDFWWKLTISYLKCYFLNFCIVSYFHNSDIPQPPQNAVAWNNNHLYFCVYEFVVLQAWSQASGWVWFTPHLPHPLWTNKLARTCSSEGNETQKGQAQSLTHMLKASVWVMSTNIPLAKANHMAEPKSKGREVRFSSSRRTAMSHGKDQGYMERRRTKANNSIHTSVYIFKSWVTTVKGHQFLECSKSFLKITTSKI